MSYETCFLCDSETGRAGAGDDSIYDELGKGPYCIECYNRQIPARLRTLNELSLTDDAAEEIDTLRARVAELEAQVRHLTPWKDAIIDGLVVGHIYNSLHETNAKVALNALISWETSIALDPLVSSEAQALVDRGRAELEAQIAAHERVCAGTWVPTEHGGHLNAIAIHFDNLFGQAHALDYRGYTTHLLKPELPTSSGEGE